MNTVKYFFTLSLFISGVISAQLPCPAVIATVSDSCSNNPVQLNASAGFTNYLWSPSAGLSNPGIANPIAFTSGTYTITA
ncbi:MAG TPA: hypothetical protein VFJ43_06495, partial [Bacteroidia bacterium]|nr:hypothetical protein [Bacteroidia bacterium]